MTRRRPAPLLLVAATVTALVAGGAPVAAQPAAPAASPGLTVPDLPLGPAELPQEVEVQQLAPGLTRTRVVRGAVDPDVPWVVELAVPALSTSPDPDAPARSVQDAAAAQQLVDRLGAAGFAARAQPVRQPATADLPASVLGQRVRLAEPFEDQASAREAVARLRAAGFSGRDWYSGWDGGSDASGRWVLDVLAIDPATFAGELGASYGPDLERRETVSGLSASLGAAAAVNGGFFVLDPAAGAPGDPAGGGVHDGVVLSEPVGDRPVLVLDEDGGAGVVRPSWRGTVALSARPQRPGARGEHLVLDGVNRVPGLVRNCGGTGDRPTDEPRHDVTCTDDDELVAFTDAFGARTPSGPGREVVVDAAGSVVAVHEARGVALAPGHRSVQAIGDRVEELAGARPGDRLRVRTAMVAGGRSLAREGTSVVNGGPELVRGGRQHVTQARDGMTHPGNPSFAYGWALQRNPRTFAGVDSAGRTLLVTVAGRQLGEMGLSVGEAAAVAEALGMREAVNLDGGGSTAMVVGGDLVTSVSDATGERPVGDVVYVR
ncbi:phosphodiester glycosidase family protein [uncultured Pseudokineococcus sp.]|uniref:phosphodiester glycosidase family protein n=1 Tax=uncultured Pseudokineococcus sp. TaxID=1642928 RepID=UPI00260ECF19|nr:phosphodiester glycosidase family protein [uncultured Pseudokineococcus sp.]